MKTSAFIAKIGVLSLVVSTLSGLQACQDKKVEPEFYLSATIDGKSWRANVNNNQNTVVGAAKSNGLVAVIGQQKTDKTGMLVVIFPESVAQNQAVTISESKYLAVAFTPDNLAAYTMEPSKGGSGTLTVTRFDEENKIVEGTFSGEAINLENRTKLKITNGRFRSQLFAVAPSTPATPSNPTVKR